MSNHPTPSNPFPELNEAEARIRQLAAGYVFDVTTGAAGDVVESLRGERRALRFEIMRKDQAIAELCRQMVERDNELATLRAEYATARRIADIISVVE